MVESSLCHKLAIPQQGFPDKLFTLTQSSFSGKIRRGKKRQSSLTGNLPFTRTKKRHDLVAHSIGTKASRIVPHQMLEEIQLLNKEVIALDITRNQSPLRRNTHRPKYRKCR